MVSSPAPRVPDLHKSAFWIYGVTAMVMREPLGIVLRHASGAGWSDAAVRLEALRTLIVLLLMSKQFLASGIYFDRVYIQPESGERFPRRSYPMDFLFGMGALLVAVGASTVVASTTTIFDAVTGVMLLSNVIWLGAATAAGHSTTSRIMPAAILDLIVLGICAGAYFLLGSLIAYAVLLGLLGFQMVRLIRGYNEA